MVAPSVMKFGAAVSASANFLSVRYRQVFGWGLRAGCERKEKAKYG
jgi:hypothetical protein